MRILLTLTLFFCLTACNHKKESIASKYINEQHLEEQSFVINTSKDTSVTTKGGLSVFIAANAIESSGSSVTLVMKEALSIEEMLQAGLTTKSKGGMLSSDGMFYINTKEKSTIKNHYVSRFLPIWLMRK